MLLGGRLLLSPHSHLLEPAAERVLRRVIDADVAVEAAALFGSAVCGVAVLFIAREHPRRVRGAHETRFLRTPRPIVGTDGSEPQERDVSRLWRDAQKRALLLLARCSVVAGRVAGGAARRHATATGGAAYCGELARAGKPQSEELLSFCAEHGLAPLRLLRVVGRVVFRVLCRGQLLLLRPRSLGLPDGREPANHEAGARGGELDGSEAAVAARLLVAVRRLRERSRAPAEFARGARAGLHEPLAHYHVRRGRERDILEAFARVLVAVRIGEPAAAVDLDLAAHSLEALGCARREEARELLDEPHAVVLEEALAESLARDLRSGEIIDAAKRAPR
mmetsp:Transcript_4561/g.15734  ORF Transcript_4561/g.15734 Transcript_4561/m.15734 type:complete len:336 (-) Transcript_4561:723-1730(-)